MPELIADLRPRVVSTIAEILEIPPDDVRGGARLREDLGMDSLASLELLSVLSHDLAIELEMEQAMDIRTVDDALAFVDRHYRAQRGEAPARV